MARKKKQRKTNPKTLATDERHITAYRLRMAGAKLQDIADALDYKNAKGAQKAILAGQRKLHIDPALNSKALNQDRLEVLLQSLWSSAGKGALGSTDRVIKIVQELNKMDGNYEPMKIAPTDPTGTKEYGADTRSDLISKLLPGIAAAGTIGATEEADD